MARFKRASESIVTIDRRRGERRDKPVSTVVKERTEETNRRKVQRRRQIDPTTCERDYTQEEVEFMNAMEAYKRTSGRMFPTCSEVLEVIRSLGYTRSNRTEEPIATPVSAEVV